MSCICFPAQGLSSQILCDRIGEIYEMAGCGTFDEFLKNWSPIPILPGIGGAPRFLAVLTRRTALLGTDLCAFPPQLLCQRPVQGRRMSNEFRPHMQCNLTFHSPCVRMWSAALWNASTFSTVPKRTHAIKMTTKMIRYSCNHFLTRICQWFERKIRISLLPSTTLANAMITRMQIIKPKGEEG